MWLTVFRKHGYIMFYSFNYLSFCSDGGWRLFFREQGTLPRTKENRCLKVQCTFQEHGNVLKRGPFSRKLIYSPRTCGVPFYKKLLNLKERTFYLKTVIKLKVDYDKLFMATLSLATPSHHSFPEIWTKTSVTNNYNNTTTHLSLWNKTITWAVLSVNILHPKSDL